MKVEMFTFLVTALICLIGAGGTVLLRNPVHNALSLVATLFGIAVLFMTLDAYFLAAIQVIVYAGAIVILFLFVLMLLGVDQSEQLKTEPILAQRPAALAVGAAVLGLSVTALLSVGSRATGAASTLAAIDPDAPDIDGLARVLFTDYVFAFEVTSVLLTVAVVGAVVLSRPAGAPIDLDEFPDGTTVEIIEARRQERLDELAAEADDAEADDAGSDPEAGTDEAGTDRDTASGDPGSGDESEEVGG